MIFLINSANEQDLSLLTGYAKNLLRGPLLRGTIGYFMSFFCFLCDANEQRLMRVRVGATFL